MAKPAARRRVLVVEDDREMLGAYRRFFGEPRAAEFSARFAADGEQALAVLREEPVDIVVLDWALPGISGASLAKALRADSRTRAAGILMVTAKSGASQTVLGLEAGADDYLTKPFEWSVLLARLRSLSRRSALTLDRHLTRRYPGLELDLDAGRLTLDARRVAVTPKELELLRIFLMRPDILHSMSYLWQAVWGYESDRWEHTFVATMSLLRKKLGPKWGARLITCKGKGYLFDPSL